MRHRVLARLLSIEALAEDCEALFLGLSQDVVLVLLFFYHEVPVNRLSTELASRWLENV